MAKTVTLVTPGSKAHYSASNIDSNFSALNTNFTSFLHLGGTSESSNSMTGPLDMGGKKVTNMGAQSLSQDAAQKAYVDQQLSDIDFGNISITFDLADTGALAVSDVTQSTSIVTGSGTFAGGVGITKNLWVGGTLNVAGAATLQAGGVLSGVFSGAHSYSGVVTFSSDPIITKAGSPILSLIDTTNTMTTILQAQNTIGVVGTNSTHDFWVVVDGNAAAKFDIALATEFLGNITVTKDNGFLEVVDPTNTTTTKIQSQNTIGIVGTASTHALWLVVDDAAVVKFGTSLDSAFQGPISADQSSDSAAVPVLVLDQADIDDTFINLVGTSAADSTRSISSSTAEAAAKFGAFRVEINGTTKWVRVYDSAV